MSRWIDNWMEFSRRSLRRFVNYGNQPHPSPALDRGREQTPKSPLWKGGFRKARQRLLLILTIAIVSACSTSAIEH
ncbi:hypothetical protein [Nostoc sp. NMS9]|uniref:hypothetical protein n=1 Tax=Nostoc sp. NMS9 TaxID=2815393 RepID=UPI0025D51538|nr:hypothetical protein [Nostoc sp. NMS9]